MPQNRHKSGFRGPSPDVGKATQFQSGNRANPGGRPKKKPITEIYERILAKNKNCKDIEAAVLKAIKSHRAETIAVLREMADRIEGKVSQPLEVSGLEGLAEKIREGRKRAGDRFRDDGMKND